MLAQKARILNADSAVKRSGIESTPLDQKKRSDKPVKSPIGKVITDTFYTDFLRTDDRPPMKGRREELEN
ncbi:hypothetical protein EVAR_74657_1 [Eumeta japonica]|uniref:Uncharacterized protein n=1 Tax=Eumeta variegata TaxID=151549 RepID=A0A4C1WCE5_EUMVA|nr:hypothetical protein EVAR_74657_1 [Eumeta japonica]